tara:strand:+ start:228 stop:473 length:246 start_codon:yes stop_codon:yes gene_type:complete
MITDKQMIELGFRKLKTFKKRKTGVSSFCWENYGMILTIEKNLGSDFGDEYFLPTLRIGFAIWYFSELEDLKKLLKALNIN